MTLTPQERDQLRVLAARIGVSVPRLLVESALGGGERLVQRPALLARLDRLSWLTANLANNVNQIAHQANTDGRVRNLARLETQLEQVRDLHARVEELAKDLG